jgi:drug/metabolite transporter (DMT)-like permease
MGVLIKAISFDLGAFSQTFLRLIVSALLTLLLVLFRSKPLLLKKKSDYLIMFFMGIIGYGFQIMFYTLAFYHTTISNAIFIFSSYPIIAAFMAYIFLKEHISKRLLVAILLLSCVLFLLFDPNDLTKNLLGNSFALFASLTTAFYIICSRVLSKRGNAPETITLWSVILAVIVSGFSAYKFEHITFSLEPMSLILLVIFGFMNAAAFNFTNKGFVTVNTGIGTMILLLEPVIGSFLGFVFFGEVPTMTFITGAVIMFISIYIALFKLDE